ncbi:uncharacterized protein LOC131995776 [Stomoxys calcitrans]|uniref:uncharacterized protein LOC131995776 n=1 Tax=Stomoxys calcitrans TaxID=35570 RepID=UPI0027E2EB1A|nr:uncharacterized protein LOC131995776 [Stomoxys calcitrans]
MKVSTRHATKLRRLPKPHDGNGDVRGIINMGVAPTSIVLIQTDWIKHMPPPCQSGAWRLRAIVALAGWHKLRRKTTPNGDIEYNAGPRWRVLSGGQYDWNMSFLSEIYATNNKQKKKKQTTSKHGTNNNRRHSAHFPAVHIIVCHGNPQRGGISGVLKSPNRVVVASPPPVTGHTSYPPIDTVKTFSTHNCPIARDQKDQITIDSATVCEKRKKKNTRKSNLWQGAYSNVGGCRNPTQPVL